MGAMAVNDAGALESLPSMENAGMIPNLLTRGLHTVLLRGAPGV